MSDDDRSMCLCGHTSYAHSEVLGCRACACTGYIDETLVEYSPQEKHDWNVTKLRIGLRKDRQP